MQVSEERFSYETLNKHFNASREFLEDDLYMVSVLPTNPLFIGFMLKEDPKGTCREGEIFKRYGLKFHISLPEYDRPQFNQGWNITRDILIKHKVASFKVVRDNVRMSETPGQEGKEVTVYVDCEPNRTLGEWNALLQELTQKLTAEKISPGYRAPGTQEKREEPINGCNYVTYRYFNEKRKKSEWPSPDPCIHLTVNVPDQLNIPVRSTNSAAAAAETAGEPAKPIFK